MPGSIGLIVISRPKEIFRPADDLWILHVPQATIREACCRYRFATAVAMSWGVRSSSSRWVICAAMLGHSRL